MYDSIFRCCSLRLLWTIAGPVCHFINRLCAGKKKEGLTGSNFVEISYFKQRYRDPFFFPSKDSSGTGLSALFGRRVWSWESNSISPYLQFASVGSHANSGSVQGGISQSMYEMNLGAKYQHDFVFIPRMFLSLSPLLGLGKSKVLQSNEDMQTTPIEFRYYKYGLNLGTGYRVSKDLSLTLNYELSNNLFIHPKQNSLNYNELSQRFGISTLINFD